MFFGQSLNCSELSSPAASFTSYPTPGRVSGLAAMGLSRVIPTGKEKDLVRCDSGYGFRANWGIEFVINSLQPTDVP